MRLWNTSILGSDTQLNQHSYYEASVQRPPDAPRLQGTVQADVVVVGGGFAGLSAAIELAQHGRSVVVLEAERVCAGASGRNGGQAIVGIASGQGVPRSQLGREDASRIWGMSLEAIRLIDERIAAFDIDCERTRGYLYVADAPHKARQLQAELETSRRDHGLQTDFVQGADVARYIRSGRYCAAAYESVSGHLHPLKYGLGLARAARALGVRIYEHSPVTGLQRGATVVARTAQGAVQADFAVLAGNCTLAEHGPAVAPEIRARIMPVGTYIIATDPLPESLCERLIPSGAAVCDNNFVLDYFRFSADRRMLFGGRVSYTTRTPRQLGETMRQRMAAIFPELASAPVAYLWGGFVDISMNRAPDFGRVAPNVFYLQGFSGHGVALTGLAGRLVAEAVRGQSDRLDVFARLRHRRFPGGSRFRTPALALAMAWERLRDTW